MATAAPLEGWYPDPEGGTRLRWWDGADWTDRYRTRPLDRDALVSEDQARLIEQRTKAAAAEAAGESPLERAPELQAGTGHQPSGQMAVGRTPPPPNAVRMPPQPGSPQMYGTGPQPGRPDPIQSYQARVQAARPQAVPPTPAPPQRPTPDRLRQGGAYPAPRRRPPPRIKSPDTDSSSGLPRALVRFIVVVAVLLLIRALS